MFDLDRRIRDWGQRQECESSLSPRELDELQDHLRLHVDLELQLNTAVAPVQAFAIARDDLGEPAALSREFARAGKPRWRRWLVTGWGLFALSFLLPAYISSVRIPPPAPDGTLWTARVNTEMGLDAFGNALVFGDRLGVLSALTNVLILASLLALRSSRRRRGGRLRWLVGGAGILNLTYWPIWMVTEGDPISYLLVGYWTWVASFFCVATGLWMLAGERTASGLVSEGRRSGISGNESLPNV